jgi:hypothetical protein
MKKFFLFAAVAMLALVGCEKQTQSGIELNDVKGEAIVKGRLIDYFNEPGKATEAVNFSGVRVYVTISAGDFVSDGEGNIAFNDTTKADGSFEIPVKVGAKAMKAKINTESFFVMQGERKIYYEAIHQDLNNDLNAGDGYDVTSEVAPTKDAVLNATVGDAKVKGTLKYNIGIPAEGKGVESVVPAAEGEKLFAIVKYFAGEPQEIEKRFALTVGKNGVFEGAIPVEEAGNDFKIEVPQSFRDNYGAKNAKGERISVTASYEYPATDAGHLTAGQVTTLEAIVLKGTPEEIVTKNTKFTVKGKINLAAEVFTYADDKDNDGNKSKINGTEKGKKAYTPNVNGGKFQLRVSYKDNIDGKDVEGQINYDLVVSDKGTYSQEVAIYDTWALDKVKLEIFVNEFAVENFTHYYYNYQYKEDDSWKKNDKGWCDWSKSDGMKESYAQTQKCVGVYGQEDAIGAGKPNKFFDVTVDAEIPFRMTQDSYKALKGVGTADIDVVKDGSKEYTLYKGGMKWDDLL